jgi:hypothetical protein
LLDAGAIIDMASTKGYSGTELYYAIRDDQKDVVQTLIDRGAKLSNVKLNEDLPMIPKWVNAIIELRLQCQVAAIVIIGIHKFHRSIMTGNNDNNVFKLICKHILSCRVA